MKCCTVLAPTAILGYGFPEASFYRGMEKKPDVIAVDAGSTDPGPYYLGAGKSFTNREAVKRDLAIMIPAGLEAGIPVLIGTAGGCGAKPHLDWNLDIILEIAREKGLSFTLAVIPADIPRETVLAKLRAGEVTPLSPAPPLGEEELGRSVNIVAQMGPEPLMEALRAGAQVVLAGRAYDPAVFAALPLVRGFDKGLAVHMGKILECAAIAATPGSGSDCMIGYLGEDSFTLEPLSDARACTALSVSAHTLYEKSDPVRLPGPGGALDLSGAAFEQESARAVRVRGSRFVPSDGYFVKLEGVRRVGFRTVSLAGARDPIFISRVSEIASAVKERVRDNFGGTDGVWLDVKLYGQSGVMGMFPGLSFPPAAEIGIVIEAVAPTQAEADTVCSFARSTMLHYGYPGRKSTAGNLAFPFSPSDFSAGEVFAFSLYHLMRTDDPSGCFPVGLMRCEGGVCRDL